MTYVTFQNAKLFDQKSLICHLNFSRITKKYFITLIKIDNMDRIVFGRLETKLKKEVTLVFNVFMMVRELKYYFLFIQSDCQDQYSRATRVNKTVIYYCWYKDLSGFYCEV